MHRQGKNFGMQEVQVYTPEDERVIWLRLLSFEPRLDVNGLRWLKVSAPVFKV